MSEGPVAMMSALMAGEFAMGCAVNQSFQVVGATAQDSIPKAWKDEEGVTINENQELQNNWAASFKKGKFHFFGLKWNFVGGDQTDALITCTRKPNDKSKLNGLIGVCRNDTWIMAAFRVLPPMSKEKPEKGVFKNFDKAQKKFEECAESCGYEKDD